MDFRRTNSWKYHHSLALIIPEKNATAQFHHFLPWVAITLSISLSGHPILSLPPLSYSLLLSLTLSPSLPLPPSTSLSLSLSLSISYSSKEKLKKTRMGATAFLNVRQYCRLWNSMKNANEHNFLIIVLEIFGKNTSWPTEFATRFTNVHGVEYMQLSTKRKLKQN